MESVPPAGRHRVPVAQITVPPGRSPRCAIADAPSGLIDRCQPSVSQRLGEFLACTGNSSGPRRSWLRWWWFRHASLRARPGARTAGPATIELTSPWRPAKVPEYVASFGDFTPDFGVEPDERWEQLGEHRTDAILEVDTEVETRCDPNTCRTCVTTISARIGFTPSEIRLAEELRRNRCARKLTMLHERQHEAVTRKAQAMAMREAKRNLRWARSAHAAHVTRANGREAGQEEIMRKVGEDLTRALEKAMAYEEAENTRLDRPQRYRRESRKQWRICGN